MHYSGIVWISTYVAVTFIPGVYFLIRSRKHGAADYRRMYCLYSISLFVIAGVEAVFLLVAAFYTGSTRAQQVITFVASLVMIAMVLLSAFLNSRASRRPSD